MKTLLALDLGTTTGWASNSGGTASGWVSFKNSRFEGGGMRYLRFAKWLRGMHDLTAIEEVHFEEVRRHLGVDAAHAYGGFLATLTSFCEEWSIPYQGHPVGSIKRHVTGTVKGKKDGVIAAIKARYPHVKDDNEADALALLSLALDQPPWSQE